MGDSVAALITALEGVIRGLLDTLRAFAGSLRPEAPAKAPAEPVAHFGEHERLEESKYYPPAPPDVSGPEEGELPDSYGRTRVVLLAVDPYLVHAYWEVAPDVLRAAYARAGAEARSVLRFYEAGGSFDVEVDLRTRNWYVRLWSAGRSYSVDLGLADRGGSFVRLASSNAAETPRSLPVTEVGERFMRPAEPGEHAAEIVPPPSYRKPVRAAAPQQPVAPARAVPASSSLTLQERLREYAALRFWRPAPAKPEEAPAREPAVSRPMEPSTDLTEWSETREVMGLSSALLQEGPREQ